VVLGNKASIFHMKEALFTVVKTVLARSLTHSLAFLNPPSSSSSSSSSSSLGWIIRFDPSYISLIQND
jgi:hypothetical protein